MKQNYFGIALCVLLALALVSCASTGSASGKSPGGNAAASSVAEYTGAGKDDLISFDTPSGEKAKGVIDAAHIVAASLEQGFAGNLKSGAVIAVFPLMADNADEGEEILEQISIQLVNTQKYTLIEKGQLDELLAEHDFQNSGLVDGATIVGIGKLLGADVVIFGALNGSGANRRLELWAADVARAAIITQTFTAL
jgi:hypothetical protein